MSEAARNILASFLETRTGQQLGSARRWRLETALRSLMRERGVGSLEELVAALVGDRESELADQVVDALLNNETYFFRDKTAFDQLLGAALSRVERARNHQRRLRIWCAGCSTGQEAYSIAMALEEEAPRWRGWTVDLIATDISQTAIAQARRGLYSQFEVQRGLPVRQMMRWFVEKANHEWQLTDAIRRKVRFEVRSLVDTPPMPGSFDIVLCRNVLLYFSPRVRQTVFARLAEATAPDACLMLGAGETVIGQTDDFASDPNLRGLYFRSTDASPRLRAQRA